MIRSAAFVTSIPGSSILNGFVRSLISLAKAFRDRGEVMNLAELDERMLKDIGLTHGDVECALAEPMHRRPSWVLVRQVESRKRAPLPISARRARLIVELVDRS